MAFPVVESITEYSRAVNDATHDIIMPATVNSGDLLIIIFGHDEAVALTSGPTGFTQLGGDSNLGAGGTGGMYVHAKVADGTEDSGTFTYTLASVSEGGAAQTYRITAWEGTLAGVEISAITEGGASASVTFGSGLTPSWGADDTLWLAVCSSNDDDAAVSVYPTNYTNGLSTQSGSGTNDSPAVHSARRELNGTSDTPGTLTLDQSEYWGSFTIGIQPASAASGRIMSSLANRGGLAGTGGIAGSGGGLAG